MSYKVDIIEQKDSIKQLEASMSSIKDFLKDILSKKKVLSTK